MAGAGGRPDRPPRIFHVWLPGASVGDEAVTRELVTGLGERQIRRRDDHVGLLEHVVADGPAVAAYELQQRREGRQKGLLVTRLDGRDDLVVQLVEAVGVLVGEVVLPFGGDADDHAGRSSDGVGGAGAGAGVAAGSPEPSAGCGAAPCPSSARKRARSSSTAEELESSCSWRSMS